MAISLKPATDPKQFNFPKSGSLTSLIIVNKGGTFYLYAMTILADSSYTKGDYGKIKNNTYRNRDKDFTGEVFYNRMDGSLVNGWKYTNGVITGNMSQAAPGSTSGQVTQSINKQHIDVAQETDCSTTTTTTYWENCSYYVDDEFDQYPFNCYYYTTQSKVTTCTTTTGTSTGGGTSAPPPCTPPSGTSDASSPFIENTRTIIDVAAPPGSGVSGGIVDNTNQIGTNACPPVVPPDTTKKVNPCLQKMHLDSIAQNAIIKNQNTKILAETDSTQKEYGTPQNLKSLTGTTYVNTPVTVGSSDSYNPTVTWDPVNGYTVGWSHGHPGGSAPSPDDIFVMPDKLDNNAILKAAGTPAKLFYQSHVSIEVVTDDNSFIVTVNNWATMQALFVKFVASPIDPATQLNAFDDNYLNVEDAYIKANPSASEKEAGEYALMTIFGDSIKIYEAPKGSTTFTPLTITADATGKKTVANLPCP